MPIILDDELTEFPHASEADDNGIVAIGGDLSPRRLLTAYRQGIFPWPHKGLPLLWFSPDPRIVLHPHELKIDRSLSKAIKKSSLKIVADQNFLGVINKCRDTIRPGQSGTWISEDMIEGYHQLHRLGFAHSIEAYDHGRLIGGLYGVSIGQIFFGESMFSEQSNASKICLLTLVAHLASWGFELIDCQAHTAHMHRFGAKEMNRVDFLALVKSNQALPCPVGPWSFSMSPGQAMEWLKNLKLL